MMRRHLPSALTALLLICASLPLRAQQADTATKPQLQNAREVSRALDQASYRTQTLQR